LRRYETVFILRSDLGDIQSRETIKRFEGIVATGGGELIETDEWGVREMAYKIRNERRGLYVRLDYTAPAAAVSEVERNLKLSDGVLRYLSVMLEEQADAARIRAEIETRKRRAEEARAAAESRAAAAAAAAQVPAAAAIPDAPEELQTPESDEPETSEPNGGEQQN
jgi:small subunit ribosomal protein S6